MSFEVFRRISSRTASNYGNYIIPGFISGGKRYSSTIYAVSTSPAKAAIAIIRISGENAQYVYKSLTQRKIPPKPRYATVSTLYSPKTFDEVLDQALTIFFKGPNSYTGEDLLELHVHGGTAVVRAVLNSIKALNDVSNHSIRSAEPGEFTRRAFHNNRLDLTQIEGIRDIIDAQTEHQRRAATEAAGGKSWSLYSSWRKRVVHNMALLTALIDFSDDSDITSATELFAQAKANISSLLEEVQSHLNRIQRSELMVSGIQLSLLGPPNAGKSHLLNVLTQREAAIVSDVPGTTRDVLEVSLDIAGFKVILADTAGLRSLKSVKGNDQIEAEGIRRAKQRFRAGDVVLTVFGVESSPVIYDGVIQELRELQLQGKHIIAVLNKIDLLPSPDKQAVIGLYSGILDLPADQFQLVSCLTGEGISDLVDRIANVCKDITVQDNEVPVGASDRVRDLIENDVARGLRQFLEYDNEEDVVLAMDELRCAVEGIGKITGQGIAVDEILGELFNNFCIGK